MVALGPTSPNYRSGSDSGRKRFWHCELAIGASRRGVGLRGILTPGAEVTDP